MIRLEKWRSRISDAIVNGTFSDWDRVSVSNWATCAVGELSVLLGNPINFYNKIREDELSDKMIYLGSMFTDCVYDNRPQDALDILKEIEEIGRLT